MLIQIILEAWIALKRNMTRSLLTMLGIGVGYCDGDTPHRIRQ